jgi:hypothetical protein
MMPFEILADTAKQGDFWKVFWKTLPIVVIVLGICWWAIWKFQLPFVHRVFWTTFAVVSVLVITVWALVFLFTDYERTDADAGGTIISTVIFSYLVHLWIIPLDESPPPTGRDPHDAPSATDENPG